MRGSYLYRDRSYLRDNISENRMTSGIMHVSFRAFNLIRNGFVRSVQTCDIFTGFYNRNRSAAPFVPRSIALDRNETARAFIAPPLFT